MTTFAILLGGRVKVTPRLRNQLESVRVIAADSGMVHAAMLGLSPELWVGDFDSAGEALERTWRHVPRAVFPTDKNATDGELAVGEALRRGATALVLVGGLGGQFDHVLGHGVMLLSLAARGIAVFGTSGNEEAYPLLSRLQLSGLDGGTRLSIVGLDALEGLTLRGVRWPLTDAHVPFGSSLTLSNETAGDVQVTLAKGRALVMVYPT